jgi:hypothetical protein
MVAGLREEARLASLDVRVVEGRWPDVVDEVGRVDVAMCANVVYDVADLAPFLSSLQRVATRGVVVELTAAHPWANLAPYYRRLHDLDRPDGPSVDDFVAVVREVIDIDPIVESWSRAGRVWFADWDELLALQRRRLVLTPDRDDELRRVLEPDVEVRDGRLYLGGSARTMATVWWPGASVRHA